MVQQSSYLLILITLWFLLERTLPEEICLLPTNMKMQLYPGLVNVTWDCNITKSMESYEYRITLQGKTIWPLNVSACFYKCNIVDHMHITIHKGFHARVSIRNSNCSSVTQDLTAIPEGEENTAAENFSCVVYNVSIVNCSWTAGTEAPEDTQYSLVLRDQTSNLPCEDYRTDSFGRQVGCVWKSPNIRFESNYSVELVGSSKETSIRFFDESLKLENYVILDPPENISLNYRSNELEITWEKPRMYSNEDRKTCYNYNININGIIHNIEGQYSYIAHKQFSNEKINVSMRAQRKKLCSGNENWSRWSEPLIHDPKSDATRFTPHHLLTLLGIVTAVVLLALIFLCHRFRILKRLFPKVPQPTVKFYHLAEQKELSGQKMSKMESLQEKHDNEECICSTITEISQKEEVDMRT